jgi:hypothetical protein
MSSERPPPIQPPPAQSGREWLFQRSGQVFGPVGTADLIQMLYRGELNGETPIAGDDGAFRPLSEIPSFLVHAKKAEAQLRVEAEVTGARLLRRRQRLWRIATAALLSLVLLGAGTYGAYWLATVKPWQKRSALLEDFGDGISLVMPARVGGGHHAAAEVDVPVGTPFATAPGEGSAPRRAQAPAPTAGKSAASQSAVVVAHYDQSHIQALTQHEQPTLVPCLRAESKRSPDFKGDIPIEFAIGNDGRVTLLWIDEPRFKHGELFDCLLRTLKTWPFRPFSGERPTVSLSFRIGAR